MFHFELEITIRRQIHAQHEKLSRLIYSGAFLKNSYYYTDYDTRAHHLYISLNMTDNSNIGPNCYSWNNIFENVNTSFCRACQGLQDALFNFSFWLKSMVCMSHWESIPLEILKYSKSHIWLSPHCDVQLLSNFYHRHNFWCSFWWQPQNFEIS